MFSAALHDFIEQNSCIVSFSACVFLTFSYVSSLYIWRSKLSRDHPTTIKRRFFSVSCVMLLAPYVVRFFLTENTLRKGDVYQHMGLRESGIVYAAIVPLLLTVILFLGPLTMQFFSGLWKLYSEPIYWLSSWRDLIWVRNHIVAPLSEEWVFRSCTIPLLLQCFKPITAIFIGPLFFGLAHFHHISEQMRAGRELKTALLVTAFQFFYTSLFGAYSSYLFIRTGHFVAPLIAHMFCNHMGFPNFTDIRLYRTPQQSIIIFNYLLGFGLWCFLLPHLTSPTLYDNGIDWES